MHGTKESVIGWGDELIATGQARVLQETNRGKVIVQDRNGAQREHAMWHGNPRIALRSDRPHKPQYLANGPGVRPYIATKSDVQWGWKEFACPPGEIYFTPDEIAHARVCTPGVVIEPNCKQKASPNKDWGLARWIELVALMRAAGLRPTQLGSFGTRLIPGAEMIETPGFRFACAVLAKAKAAVLPEGGLHHAAAALKVPAVVIFGGFISPAQTGYAGQVSLFTGGKPCGMRIPCEHCAEAMAVITPRMVMDELLKVLDGR